MEDRMLKEPETPTRRSAGGIGLAAIGATLIAPGLASAAEPDAELIALCDRLVANEQAQPGLHGTDGNEAAIDRALELLYSEWDDLLAQIQRIDGPTTFVGARAMARAALKITPRNIDGDMVASGEPEQMLFVAVSRFLTGSAVV
jgi:hypothetical protein